MFYKNKKHVNWSNNTKNVFPLKLEFLEQFLLKLEFLAQFLLKLEFLAQFLLKLEFLALFHLLWHALPYSNLNKIIFLDFIFILWWHLVIWIKNF